MTTNPIYQTENTLPPTENLVGRPNSYIESLLRHKLFELTKQLAILETKQKKLIGNREKQVEDSLMCDTLRWKIAKVNELIKYGKDMNLLLTK